MGKVELYVKLVIPDTTAITAFHTLKRMETGVKKLERYDYYSFEGELSEKFFDKIKKVDVLVNANKHDAFDHVEKGKAVNVLVQDLKSGQGLLNTLRERLGLSEIKSMEKGVLWKVYGKADMDKVKKLLYNKNYQKISVL